MKKSYISILLLTALIAMMFVGCKPYDVPEFVEIGTNEAAFTVPLDTDGKAQASLLSEEYYKSNMVKTKRVQIPHRWIQTGYQSIEGKYIDTLAVVKVDLAPVSFTWDKSDPATKVGVESKESIGFTVPISGTAMLSESDLPRYLAKYTASKKVSDVVNKDVNAFIRSRMSAEFGVLTLEQCKANKQKILDAVKDDATKYFSQYGIQITQFGMTDGFIYDNEGIQEAIDKQATLQAEGRNLEESKANAEKQRAIDLGNAINEAAIANKKAEAASTLLKLADVKMKEQEIENSKIIAQGQAQAMIEFAKNVKMPDVIPEGVFYNTGLDKLMPTMQKK